MTITKRGRQCWSPPHFPDRSCNAAVRRRSAGASPGSPGRGCEGPQRGAADSAPVYVAIAKGYFDESASTACRDHKAATSPWRSCCPTRLISRSSALSRQIYVQNSDSPVNIPIFCGSPQPTASCWSDARRSTSSTGACKEGILGFRVGQHAGLLFLEARCVRTGLIRKGREAHEQCRHPGALGSWLAGQNQYAIFHRSDASQLELDGKATSSIGETVGPADYNDLHGHRQIHPRQQRDRSRTGPTGSLGA